MESALGFPAPRQRALPAVAHLPRRGDEAPPLLRRQGRPPQALLPQVHWQREVPGKGKGRLPSTIFFSQLF